MSEGEPKINLEQTESQPVSEKERVWNDISQKVSEFRDGNGLPIDNGIKETLVALNALGFETSQSCEGHLDWGSLAPWVDIAVTIDEDLQKTTESAFEIAHKALEGAADQDEIDVLFTKANELKRQERRPVVEKMQKVMSLLKEFYTGYAVDYDRIISIESWSDRLRICSNGQKTMEIASPEERADRLKEYQEEMADFTAFLKEKYFGTE